MSRINGTIAAKDYLSGNGLGNKLVETVIENVLAQAVTQMAKVPFEGVLRKLKPWGRHNRGCNEVRRQASYPK